MKAPEALEKAAQHMRDRAATYDKPEGERSNGATASYYELPAGATQLQELISDRDMNSQIGEIFRACYRYGRVSHSDKLRDARKILFYAQAEVVRLEKLQTAVSASVGASVESAHSEKFDQGGDGWIPWRGGNSPVNGDVYVHYRIRSGHISSTKTHARLLRWWHTSDNSKASHDCDIVAYRIAK